MSTPRTIRMTRVRRTAAITAAAVVAVLGPTACDSASADDSGGYGAGHAEHVGVVNVANEKETGDGERSRGDRSDGESRDGRFRDGDSRDGGSRDGKPDEEDPAAEPASEESDEADEADAEPFNGLDILGNDCEPSDLEPHDGFQNGERCVSTAFGEVGKAEKNPSLLITDFPEDPVKVSEDFTITVSTKNLVRDRFLGAADGGYYLESSFLDKDKLQRGHFHTACRVLETLDEPADPEDVPHFFEATQDGAGGAVPDEVEITVTGVPTAGTVQCAVWAGDGSHRIPMMERANQTPAFDVVRITVE